jgi:hypothetical protein
VSGGCRGGNTALGGRVPGSVVPGGVRDRDPAFRGRAGGGSALGAGLARGGACVSSPCPRTDAGRAGGASVDGSIPKGRGGIPPAAGACPSTAGWRGGAPPGCFSAGGAASTASALRCSGAGPAARRIAGRMLLSGVAPGGGAGSSPPGATGWRGGDPASGSAASGGSPPASGSGGMGAPDGRSGRGASGLWDVTSSTRLKRREVGGTGVGPGWRRAGVGAGVRGGGVRGRGPDDSGGMTWPAEKTLGPLILVPVGPCCCACAVGPAADGPTGRTRSCSSSRATSFTGAWRRMPINSMGRRRS